MHKIMCTFVTTMKKKKIPDRNLDTSCPAGIPCNEMPATPALRVMLGLIHLFQLYASPIDKSILAIGIVSVKTIALRCFPYVTRIRLLPEIFEIPLR